MIDLDKSVTEMTLGECLFTLSGFGLAVVLMMVTIDDILSFIIWICLVCLALMTLMVCGWCNEYHKLNEAEQLDYTPSDPYFFITPALLIFVVLSLGLMEEYLEPVKVVRHHPHIDTRIISPEMLEFAMREF
jgi:hypothetical protein